MEYITRLDNSLTSVVLLLTLLWLKVTLVDSQGTVSIPTADLSPNIGTNNYQLQCNIVSFQPAVNRAFVWTKDGEVVSWDRYIQTMFEGEFAAQDSEFGGRIIYILTILEVKPTHGGAYKCLIADGQPTSYTEAASAPAVNVQIPYFPPEGYPMCSPSGGTVAVAGNRLLLSCTSLPGYPDEVNIFLQQGSTILSSSSQTVNNMKRIDHYITPTLADDGAVFKCIITGTGQYTGMNQFCEIGPLEVVPGLPRILPATLTKSVSEDATFTCTLSAAGTIQMYTDPQTPSDRYTTIPISGGMTFTLMNVQLDDNMRVVVCQATVGGVDVFARATLNVISIVPQPTTKATTMKPATTPMVTQRITNPPVVVSDPTTPKPQQQQSPMTDGNSLTMKTGSPQPTRSGVTTKQQDNQATVTFAPTDQGEIIIIAIAAVGGLVFILIIVIIVACICCYRRRPKPVVIADDNDSFSGSEASWEARADGAMTRKSRVIYRNSDSPADPPPRRPQQNRGYEEDLAPHLLKIPDGLSTISGSTLSPSLAYAMEYLNSPEDPMRDDTSSAAFTNDSRNDERFIYSQGATDFGHPPNFDPAPPGTQGYDYPDSEMNESGTFVKRLYDSVPADQQPRREQEPDMPTYALPHRDRISKVQNVVYNPNAQNVPDIQMDHEIDRKRHSSIPYVNTAFGYGEGMVQNQIYQPQPGEHSDTQYF